MATLTNTKIKDTYDGLLKTTDNEALDVSGVTLIEDGLGNASALSVGRSGNGVSVSGNLAVDTNTLYVDASNNRVGVGTSSPDTIINASATDNTIIRLESTDTTPSADQKLGGVEFYGNGSTLGAGVYGSLNGFYEDTAGRSYLTLSTRTSTGLFERLRIDSGGQVGIGSSDPAANLEVSGNATRLMINTANSAQTVGLLFGLSQSSVASVFSDVSEQNLIFNTGGSSERMRIDSSGNITQTASDASLSVNASNAGGTASISINGLGSNGSSTAGTRIDGIPEGSGAAASMAFVTRNSSGTRAEKMRIDSSGYLRLAGAGIQFNGDTSTANALDDYEEGTFTPTMSGYSGVTYSSQIGHYTKIGRFVQVSFYMSISNIGTFTGNSFINGLPFSVGTTQAFATGGQLNIMTALNVTRDEHFAGFYNGTSNLFIYSKTGLTTYNGDNHQAGIYSGTLTYFV